jgi:hypothetical protein
LQPTYKKTKIHPASFILYIKDILCLQIFNKFSKPFLPLPGVYVIFINMADFTYFGHFLIKKLPSMNQEKSLGVEFRERPASFACW